MKKNAFTVEKTELINRWLPTRPQALIKNCPTTCECPDVEARRSEKAPFKYANRYAEWGQEGLGPAGQVKIGAGDQKRRWIFARA